jgi:hypothetical protein
MSTIRGYSIPEKLTPGQSTFLTITVEYGGERGPSAYVTATMQWTVDGVNYFVVYPSSADNPPLLDVAWNQTASFWFPFTMPSQIAGIYITVFSAVPGGVWIPDATLSQYIYPARLRGRIDATCSSFSHWDPELGKYVLISDRPLVGSLAGLRVTGVNTGDKAVMRVDIEVKDPKGQKSLRRGADIEVDSCQGADWDFLWTTEAPGVYTADVYLYSQGQKVDEKLDVAVAQAAAPTLTEFKISDYVKV